MMTMYVSPHRRNARVRRPVNRLPEDREMRLAVDVMDNDDAYEIKPSFLGSNLMTSISRF